jgi:hypothetical protein
LASAKLVYTPILLLFLLVPEEKFASKKVYYFQLGFLFLVSFVTVLFWSKIMNSLYVPYSMYNIDFRDNATLMKCADMRLQMEYILSHGFYIIGVFVISMLHTFDMYFEGYIGTFGWLDTKLPLWFVYTSYAVLFFAAITGGKKTIQITSNHKKILLAALISIIGLVLLSQHLTWDCVGGEIIGTLQGRYFIPAFPLLFILFYNTKYQNPRIVVPTIIIYSIISLSLTAGTLYTRYYVTPEIDSVAIRCDAEMVTKDNYFETNIANVFLENANTRSSEKARSLKYSVKLTHLKQFGFTYRFYNCIPGDIVKAEVWRFGTAGSIIISGGSNELYRSEARSFEKDNVGWEHLKLDVTVPADMKSKEIVVYIYNSSADSSWFDDMVISYQANGKIDE